MPPAIVKEIYENMKEDDIDHNYINNYNIHCEPDDVNLDYISLLSSDKLWEGYCDINKFTKFNKEENKLFTSSCMQYTNRKSSINHYSSFDSEGYTCYWNNELVDNIHIFPKNQTHFDKKWKAKWKNYNEQLILTMNKDSLESLKNNLINESINNVPIESVTVSTQQQLLSEDTVQPEIVQHIVDFANHTIPSKINFENKKGKIRICHQCYNIIGNDTDELHSGQGRRICHTPSLLHKIPSPLYLTSVRNHRKINITSENFSQYFF